MRITSKYIDGYRFESEVRGHTIVVDSPEEFGGADGGPMPPELLATALGTCIGMYAMSYCTNRKIPTEGLAVHTDWEKGTNPSRIASIHITIDPPTGLPECQREAFVSAVGKCMVHYTLCHSPEITISLAE